MLSNALHVFIYPFIQQLIAQRRKIIITDGHISQELLCFFCSKSTNTLIPRCRKVLRSLYPFAASVVNIKILQYWCTVDSMMQKETHPIYTSHCTSKKHNIQFTDVPTHHQTSCLRQLNQSSTISSTTLPLQPLTA